MAEGFPYGIRIETVILDFINLNENGFVWQPGYLCFAEILTKSWLALLLLYRFQMRKQDRVTISINEKESRW